VFNAKHSRFAMHLYEQRRCSRVLYVLTAFSCASGPFDDSLHPTSMTSCGAATRHIHTSIPAKHLDQTTKMPAKATQLRLMLWALICGILLQTDPNQSALCPMIPRSAREHTFSPTSSAHSA
jgi:hypothetical protein